MFLFNYIFAGLQCPNYRVSYVTHVSMQHTSSQLKCDLTLKRGFSHLNVGNFKLNYFLEHSHQWCKTVHLYTSVTVSMHICTVTITLTFIILRFFSPSFTSLSHFQLLTLTSLSFISSPLVQPHRHRSV